MLDQEVRLVPPCPVSWHAERSRSGRAGQARPERRRTANPPLPASRLLGGSACICLTLLKPKLGQLERQQPRCCSPTDASRDNLVQP